MPTTITNLTADAALAKLAELRAAIEALLPQVRRDYPTLDQCARLMRRNGQHSIECALREEARQRVLRGQWAAVTSREAT